MKQTLRQDNSDIANEGSVTERLIYVAGRTFIINMVQSWWYVNTQQIQLVELALINHRERQWTTDIYWTSCLFRNTITLVIFIWREYMTFGGHENVRGTNFTKPEATSPWSHRTSIRTGLAWGWRSQSRSERKNKFSLTCICFGLRRGTMDIDKQNKSHGLKPCLVVMADDSCPRGRGFESWCHLLDGHEIFSHWFFY